MVVEVEGQHEIFLPDHVHQRLVHGLLVLPRAIGDVLPVADHIQHTLIPACPAFIVSNHIQIHLPQEIVIVQVVVFVAQVITAVEADHGAKVIILPRALGQFVGLHCDQVRPFGCS